MTLKLGPITPEMGEALVRAKAREREFWTLFGYPDYEELIMSQPQASIEHMEWVKALSKLGNHYDSPMSRRMFCLGYMKGRESK